MGYSEMGHSPCRALGTVLAKTFNMVITGRVLAFQIPNVLFHCFSQDWEVLRCALVGAARDLSKSQVIAIEQKLQNAFSSLVAFQLPSAYSVCLPSYGNIFITV